MRWQLICWPSTSPGQVYPGLPLSNEALRLLPSHVATFPPASEALVNSLHVARQWEERKSGGLHRRFLWTNLGNSLPIVHWPELQGRLGNAAQLSAQRKRKWCGQQLVIVCYRGPFIHSWTLGERLLCATPVLWPSPLFRSDSFTSTTWTR